jgi:hypothetical protein
MEESAPFESNAGYRSQPFLLSSRPEGAAINLQENPRMEVSHQDKSEFMLRRGAHDRAGMAAQLTATSA